MLEQIQSAQSVCGLVAAVNGGDPQREGRRYTLNLHALEKHGTVSEIAHLASQ